MQVLKFSIEINKDLQFLDTSDLFTVGYSNYDWVILTCLLHVTQSLFACSIAWRPPKLKHAYLRAHSTELTGRVGQSANATRRCYQTECRLCSLRVNALVMSGSLSSAVFTRSICGQADWIPVVSSDKL